MKFMIAVDCEGVACVVGEPGCSLGRSANMSFASQQATREANAAAGALFDCGADKVVIWDSHGEGANLEYDQLDQRCEIVLGSGFSRRFPELDESYAGVLMVGYHAMAGTDNAILAHTYSSNAYRSIKANGVEVGEISLDAAVAGELGVPVIFVSSDDKGCQEALSFMPWVKTVMTKHGRGHHRALSKHPHVVEKEISTAVTSALANISKCIPYVLPTPVDMELEFVNLSTFSKAWIRRSGWKMSGIKKLRKSLSTMLKWQC